MGRVTHFEIQAENCQRAIHFYSQLLGWQFTQWGTHDYWLICAGDSGTPGIDGGLLPRRGGAPVDMAAVNAFVCTAAVNSLDECFVKLVTLGGQVAVTKMPIPGIGWLGYAKDTEGNIFGMMQADASAG